MDNPDTLSREASQLLRKGHSEDAYTSFLSAIELSTQQLRSAKFVRQAMVSPPARCEELLANIRSSLRGLENMVESHPTPTSTPPPLPPKPSMTKLSKRNGPLTPLARSNGPKQDLSGMSIITDHHLRGEDSQEAILQSPELMMTTVASMTLEDLLAHVAINPSMLAPAQTNAGHTFAPPSDMAPLSANVPLIPQPPLVTHHRQLELRLARLEQALHGARTEAEVQTYMRATADTRATLTAVRTLYMSAMTVPDIKHFSPRLVAYQLTLIDSAIFRNVSASALREHSSRTPHPTIVTSTDFFNYLTRSIECSIASLHEPTERATLICRWIGIAGACEELCNFQTLKAIVAALHTPQIERLRRTWECIPRRHTSHLHAMHELMSENSNYERYRKHIRLNRMRRPPSVPMVPFLGVFIHDMTYAMAANANGSLTRIHVDEICAILEDFQKAPSYPPHPPDDFLQETERPGFFNIPILKSARQRNGRLTPSSPIAQEQQRINVYLLMRTWVPEYIIDELSNIREPRRTRSMSLVQRSSSVSSSSGNSILSMRFSGRGYSTSSTNTTDPEPLTPTSEGRRPLSFGSKFVHS